MSLDDEAIIGLLLARDERGLEALTEKYRAACTSLARDVTGSAMDAEECVNDTWLRVWNTIPPEHPQSLKHYVLRITRNLSLDKWREGRADKRGGGADSLSDELDECADPSDGDLPGTDARELREAMEQFVAGLDREERAMFVLRYWNGKPVADIARAFGMLSNTVTVRLKRTRAKLRAYLTERGIQI